MKIWGKKGLSDLVFKKVVSRKVVAQQAIMLTSVEEELPSAADISKSDDTELQEITEKVMTNTKNLITELQGSEDLPMHELLGLNK